jgi:hypothetical protein
MNAHRTRNAGRVVVVCAVVLLLGTLPVRAASPEDCREFHDECTEARAAGYRDVGICNVERLECRVDDDGRVARPSHEPQDDGTRDPERARGDRSIGP